MSKIKPTLYISLGNIKNLNVHPSNLKIRTAVVLKDDEVLYCDLPRAILNHRVKNNPDSVISLYAAKGVNKKKDYAERWVLIIIKTNSIKQVIGRDIGRPFQNKSKLDDLVKNVVNNAAKINKQVEQKEKNDSHEIKFKVNDILNLLGKKLKWTSNSLRRKTKY